MSARTSLPGVNSYRAPSTTRPHLPDNAEAEVCQRPRLRHAHLLQGERRAVGAGEEPDAVAPQDGREVDHDLIEQALLEALLGEAGPEEDHVLAGGRLQSCGDSLLDAAGEEPDRGVQVRRLLEGLMGEHGEHKDRPDPGSAVGLAP